MGGDVEVTAMRISFMYVDVNVKICHITALVSSYQPGPSISEWDFRPWLILGLNHSARY